MKCKQVTIILVTAMTLISCGTPQADRVSVGAGMVPRDPDSAPRTLLEAGSVVSPPPSLAPASTPPSIDPFKVQGNAAMVAPPNFDKNVDYPDENVEPGVLTVIFKTRYKVSKNTARSGLLALDTADSVVLAETARVNTILARHRLKHLNDMAGGLDDALLDKRKSNADAFWHADIPHMKSIYRLHFPLDEDINATLAELRANPSVRCAYKSVPSTPTATLINRQSFSNMSGTTPPDPLFTSNTESSSTTPWYWFNRHRVFDSWSVTATYPAVAIVDFGFDTSASAYDGPTYDSTNRASYDASGNYISTDVSEPSTSTFSHGQFCASIIAAPKNNLVGYCGIVPGTTIDPAKSTGSEASDVAAFNKTALFPAWVTSISLGVTLGSGSVRIQAPFTWTSARGAAVSTAVGNGQIVVIAAGNTWQNIDTSTYNPSNDYGAIIVGGTQMLSRVLNFRRSIASSHELHNAFGSRKRRLDRLLTT